MNPCEPGKRTHKQRGNPEKKVIQMNHSSIQGNGICMKKEEVLITIQVDRQRGKYRLHSKGEVAKSLSNQAGPRCVTSLYYDYKEILKNQVDK